MIRYTITDEELKLRIQQLSPNWLAKAEDAHRKFQEDGKYSDGPPNWSAIKLVYMDLQYRKCAYCERALEEFKIEHDVEHYRPKSSVQIWPNKQQTALGYDFPTGESSSNGYYWLAYDPLNYATACKSCNSILKKNYFPTQECRGNPSQDVRSLNQTEMPFLIYPIGSVDEDPEKLITFRGIAAVPRTSTGYRYRRAKVTIDFFGLNTRDLLLNERADRIVLVGSLMQSRDVTKSARERSDLNAMLDALCASCAPHAACTRAFCDIWLADPTYARRLYDECCERIQHRVHRR